MFFYIFKGGYVKKNSLLCNKKALTNKKEANICALLITLHILLKMGFLFCAVPLQVLTKRLRPRLRL